MSERTNTPESTTPLSDVEQHLTYLKLSFMMEQYAALATHATQKAWSHVDYLARLAEGYTSYKVANMVLEFSTSIPRAQLRPGYGDGFLGAPLQTGVLPEQPPSQPRGGRRGTSSTPTSPHAGDAHHV